MNSSNDPNKCSFPGCAGRLPVDLEKEGLCVTHFLLAAEGECAAIRREPMAVTGPDPARRTEIENFIAESAIKLVSLGTGTVRLTDETKKRILTLFLTLMILRENIDRTTTSFQPRRKLTKPVNALEPVAAVG